MKPGFGLAAAQVDAVEALVEYLECVEGTCACGARGYLTEGECSTCWTCRVRREAGLPPTWRHERCAGPRCTARLG